jgi:NAD+ diphosphatase
VEYSQSPLNLFRNCPKCGKTKFVPDSEKSLKCGNCGFRYFFNMSASVVAIIRNQKGEVLLTKRKFAPAAGMLDLPGGFVDMGETAEEAIRREIFEELNLEICGIEYFGSFTNKYLFAEVEYQTLDLAFTCTVKTFNTLQVADDVSGCIFTSLADISNDQIGLDSIKRILRQLKAN